MNPDNLLSRRFGLILCASLFVMTSGCARFGGFAAKSADETAYEIIADKQLEAGLPVTPVTLGPVVDAALQQLLEDAQEVDLSADIMTSGSRTLTLADALGIAFANSRRYQTEKETLFTQALALSDARYRFAPNWAASGGLSLDRLEAGHDTAAGASTEWFGARSMAASVKKTFFTGATVTARMTQSYTHNATSNPRLALDVVQPLLNGAGPLVAHEPLRQAERDMTYAVREFQRFEKQFAIDIIDSFFSLLQSLDSVSNSEKSYQDALYAAERTRARADAGEIPELEGDQARAAVLRAQNGWNLRKSSYRGDLDSFKIQLGLPVSIDITPDTKELDRLAEKGLVVPDLTLEKAIDVALQERLDLKTTSETVADDGRAVEIALRDFLPNVDAGYSYSTDETRDKDRLFPRFRDNGQKWSLDIALPMNWTERRNRYRRAKIAFERSERNYEEECDGVVLEVKNRWRELDYQRENHKIQTESMRLANRQLESAFLLQELGRATQRDITEAQESLLEARDGLTQALVNYTISRLRFWHAIERLKIDPQGMWYN